MLKTLLGMALLASVAAPDSGLGVGDNVSSFHPHSVTGSLKGTDDCPTWTYGILPAIQVWIHNDDSQNVEKLVKTLDDEMVAHADKKFKAFVIFVDDKGASHEKDFTDIADKVKASQVGLAYISSGDDAIADYKINLDKDIKNTTMLYRNMTVKAKEVNFVADDKGIAKLKSEIDDLVK